MLLHRRALLVGSIALLLGGPSASAQSEEDPKLAQARAQLVTAYANGLRYFNSALTEEDAQRVAELLATEAVRQGIDARIVVAVLASDGILDTTKRVKQGNSTDLLLEGRSHRTVVTQLTKELATRIAEHAKGKPLTEKILLAALVDHAKGRKNPPSNATQHADKTLKLYRQLCGTE